MPRKFAHAVFSGSAQHGDIHNSACARFRGDLLFHRVVALVLRFANQLSRNCSNSALEPVCSADKYRAGTAMAAGDVSEEPAIVIVKGVDALPVEHRRRPRRA